MTFNEALMIMNSIVTNNKRLREMDVPTALKHCSIKPFVAMSWGISKRVNLQNKGLVLKVNGHHHKGYVLVCLDFMDTYTAYLVNRDGTIKETIEGLYCDELQDVIDEKIEKIPEYKH